MISDKYTFSQNRGSIPALHVKIFIWLAHFNLLMVRQYRIHGHNFDSELLLLAVMIMH